MPEELGLGSEVDSGTPDQPPTEEQPDVLASDLFTPDAPSDSPSASDPGSPTPGGFDPSSVDIRRTKIEDIPESHRQYYEPAFKAVAELRAGETKRDQDLQEQLQRSQQAETEWRDRIETLAAPAPEQTPLESQMEMMTAEQREGVNVVNDIVQSRVGDLPETVAQLKELVTQMYQTQNSSTQQAMVQQVADARSAHGNDIDNWADQIGALVGQTNPLTGSSYTVRESYELLSGKAAQDAESARQTDRNVRSSHQAAATSPTGTPVVSHEGLADLSRAEGRAELEALGFER